MREFRSLAEIISEHGGLIQTGPFGSQLHQYEYAEFGVPVVMPKDIVAGGIDEGTVARVTDQKADQLSRHALKVGDIVFPRRGEISKCALISEAQAGFLCGTGCLKIELPQSMLLPKFVRYYLGLPHIVEWLERNAIGTTMLNLNTRILGGVRVPIISLAEQRYIADRISAYDDLIENNRRRIALLEQSARLLYREWFVHLRFPGHEHVKVVDGVPEGWAVRRLEDISDEVRVVVKPEKVTSGTPYIGLEHMPRRSITLSDWGHSDDIASQKFAYKAGDILFGKIRPYFHKVGFALTDGITSSDAIVIRPIERNHYYFLLLLVSSDQFVALASQTVKEGSKMPRADWKFLRKQEFAVPPDGLLRELREICEPISEQLKVLASANEKLRQARDLLLPRLMSGDLEV